MQSDSLPKRVIAFCAAFWLTYCFFQWASILFVVCVALYESRQRPKVLFSLGIAAIGNLGTIYVVEQYLLLPSDAVNPGKFFMSSIPPVFFIVYFPLVALLVHPAVIGLVLRGPLEQFMINSIDHALYRAGHLGDRMFHYPQTTFAPYSAKPLIMLESTLTQGFPNWVAALDLFIDLGAVNLSEKIAGEIMENMGPYPDVMYRRVLLQIAKGKKEAASVYLNK